MAVSRDSAGALREWAPCSAHASGGMDVFPRERAVHTVCDVCTDTHSVHSSLDLHTYPVLRRGPWGWGIGLALGRETELLGPQPGGGEALGSLANIPTLLCHHR